MPRSGMRRTFFSRALQIYIFRVHATIVPHDKKGATLEE